MSETMIERVAKALSEADTATTSYQELARAAIEAMRTPTEAMNIAFENGYASGFDGIPDAEKLGKSAQMICFSSGVSAMIDAALKEPTP